MIRTLGMKEALLIALWRIIEMNTNDYIQEIKERALNDELYQRVYELYQKEIALQKSILTEQEYKEAHTVLRKNLDESKYDDLLQAEKLYEQSAKWLTQFSFIRGMFVSFQDCFVKSGPAESYRSLVFDQVLQMPKMEHYPDYYEKRSKALRLFE